MFGKEGESSRRGEEDVEGEGVDSLERGKEVVARSVGRGGSSEEACDGRDPSVKAEGGSGGRAFKGETEGTGAGRLREEERVR